MKLSLVVLTAGVQQGKVLEIKLSQFVVGRDPQCHLRPASAVISKRHCALIQRDGKAFIRDFDSTNGTFVNEEPVKGEVELHQGDKLKIGPLQFEVRIEAAPAPSRPTPPPPTKGTAARPATPAKTPIPPTNAKTAAPAPAPAKEEAAAKEEPAPEPAEAPAAASAGPAPSGEDDDIAAMLLSLQDDGPTGSGAPAGEVPEGSTVHDLTVPPEVAAQLAKAEKDKEKEKPKSTGNTSSAAKSILEKYMRRPRGG
jgi:predicted component of type VI protein secretion system